ncbi:hypothetical protein Tco_1434082, partial [Tanacetum coccineum]
STSFISALQSSCSPSHEILTLDLLRPIELQGIAMVEMEFSGVGLSGFLSQGENESDGFVCWSKVRG